MNREVVAAFLVSNLFLACSSEVSVQVLPGDEATGTRALRFERPYDRVEVPSSPLLDVPQDFAVEAWVFIESFAGGHGIFNRWQNALGDIELTFGTPEPLPAGELPSIEPVPSHTLAAWGFVAASRSWISAYSSALPTPGAWHHLAMSYGAGAFKLYVDGSRWGTSLATDRIANPVNRVFIGATARSEQLIDPTQGERWWPPIHGAIADVRMSSIDRYPGDFAPERRLSSDASTLALWHLSEGSGNVAADSGPNHLDGAIVDATWAELPSR